MYGGVLSDFTLLSWFHVKCLRLSSLLGSYDSFSATATCVHAVLQQSYLVSQILKTFDPQDNASLTILLYVILSSINFLLDYRYCPLSMCIKNTASSLDDMRWGSLALPFQIHIHVIFSHLCSYWHFSLPVVVVLPFWPIILVYSSALSPSCCVNDGENYLRCLSA